MSIIYKSFSGRNLTMGIFDENRNNSNTETNNEDSYSYMKRNRTSSILVFVVIIAVYFAYTTFGSTDSCGGKTTTGKVKLNSDNYMLLNDWFEKATEYTDSTVMDAMITFYESSGIQAYVLLVDDTSELSSESMDAKAEDYYKNGLFAKKDSSDEGHMVVAFQPATGASGIYVGTEARSVMDEAAVGQFRTIISSCYNKYSGTEILEKSFRQATSKIMGRSMVTIYIIIILAVMCVIYFVWNYTRTAKARQKQQNGGNGQ